MNTRAIAAVGATAVALTAAAFGGSQLAGTTTTVTAGAMGCNDWPVQLTTGECQAAGTIRYVALYNLQGALQFCKWKAANPGEWSRLKASAQDGSQAQVVTWFGGAIRDQLLAYSVTGAPTFTIQPNTAPNACTGKLIKPPVVAGVTPGQTDATVTIETNP